MSLFTLRAWALGLALLLTSRLAGAQQLAVGANYTLSVHADGTLWAWGSNAQGQAGLPSTTLYQPTPARVGTATTWRQVAASGYCSLGVRTDGTLWAWGENLSGQLGFAAPSGPVAPTQVGTATNWHSVSVGTTHVLAVRTDGTLWAWGRNVYGQLGTGATLPASGVQATPLQVGTATTWASVQASSGFSLALRADGTLWSWGYGADGQLGLGTTTDQHQPTQVGTATWRSLGACTGTIHALAIRTDGTLWAWGNNFRGALGTGTAASAYAPVQVGTATTWKSATAAYNRSLAVRTDGSLWAWGDNTWAALGVGNTTRQPAPVAVGAGAQWQEVSTGGYTTLARRADGSLWAWGRNAHGQFGDGSGLGLVPAPVGTATWQSASLYTSFTVAVRTDGTLWAWGNNNTGRLGTNEEDNILGSRAVPTQVGTATTWKQAAGGLMHALALRTDGTLHSWGNNRQGQIGLGNFLLEAYSPRLVSGGWATTPGSFATGDFHSLGVRPDGTLWSCGLNRYGQLGAGPLGAQRTVLAQVGTASTWRSVAASDAYSLALKADGTLWSWGANTYGQLGDGTTADHTAPAQVGTATTWVAVSAGRYYALGLQADGSLWAWGSNAYGQLGTASAVSALVPTPVGPGATWLSMAAGDGHTLAIRTDGTLWAWGRNTSGQLGLGTVELSRPPAQVSPGTTWQQVAVDENHSVAVRQDGTLWSWGDNQSGQLGRLDYAALPTRIPSGGTALAATAATAGPAWALFPNPARDRVQLRHLPAGPVRVRVMDAQGRLVRTATEATVSTQGLPPGLYLLHAAAAGAARTWRLVVE
ncbi:RCC1 domain-containing protein [Hymenobacter arizonensis]|uniref:Por secretion system C-terminal sorting domain-containing protein n=1 Tax=Hymenobacter arizonensis TaxID=1227077 RepID=A0A1I6BN16_HYMAR|nr:T9SS type A sorting domain-containing protein [Hymenobacter arizonensis]SFQ82338.1 Por secretion system C-terminal sorting domain-containing protein [Hymenobacter arizonensis]